MDGSRSLRHSSHRQRGSAGMKGKVKAEEMDLASVADGRNDLPAFSSDSTHHQSKKRRRENTAV